MSYWILPSSLPVGFFWRGAGGGRVFRFPGLAKHSPEFVELNCSLRNCVCEKDCPCNVADHRSFKANWKRWKIDHFCHPRSNLLGIPFPPPPSHSNPRSGPNRTAFSHSGRAKFARAMKVSKSGRKNQFAPEKKCRIWRCSNVTLIYILSDKNLKHVLRITLSVFERYESFLLTPDIFKPICSIESVKFQWPHAIEYNSPVSRVLVTKEPRLMNTITFPAHPGRPRGSQSGRDKRRSKRFSSTGGRVPVDNFLPTSFPTVAADLASDWRRKTSVFFCPIRESNQLSAVLENLRLPVFSRPEVGKFNVFLWMHRCRKVWSKLGEKRRPISLESDHWKTARL